MDIKFDNQTTNGSESPIVNTPTTGDGNKIYITTNKTNKTNHTIIKWVAGGFILAIVASLIANYLFYLLQPLH